MKRSIKELIIHCTSTDNVVHDNALWLKRLHVGQNGWNDIGYHYVITKSSGLELGRPVFQPGAHCRGFNGYSIGIALCGKKKFTSQQFKILEDLCWNLINIFDLKPNNISPHNKFTTQKTCPNFELDYLKEKLNARCKARDGAS